MRIRDHWKLVAVAIGLWSLMSTAVALELYDYGIGGTRASLLTLVGLQLLRFLPFVLLLPSVHLFAPGLPLTLRTTVVNAGGVLAYASLANVTFTVMERGMRSAPTGSSFIRDYQFFFPRRLAYGVAAYVLIYAASQLIHLYEDRQSERVARLELERQLTQARLQALQHQLRPHFLFNTLHAVSTLMEDDVAQARRMMALLGDLLRLSLQNDRRQEVRLEKELEALDLYLEIERIRFQDRLEIERHVPHTALEALVPFFVLQPLAENAITHGISRRSSSGKVSIRAEIDNGMIGLSVSDDGPGAVDGPSTGGVGLRNLAARLQQLYGAEASLETESPPAGGFHATIRLPLQLPASQVP